MHALSTTSRAGFCHVPRATFWTSARATAGSPTALLNWAMRPVAVDIFSDPRDGFGAARHYPVHFPVIESGFDDLPFPDAQFDLAVFNSSIHYSSDYVRTLSRRADACVPMAASSFSTRRSISAENTAKPCGSSARSLSSAGMGSARRRWEHRILRSRHARGPGRKLSLRLGNPSSLVRLALASAARASSTESAAPPFALLDSGGKVSMIILLHPRSTRPKNRRFPLSVLALGGGARGQGRV